MRINFKQGILRYPTNITNQNFLFKAVDNVNILTSNGSTTYVFSFGMKNYTYTETVDVTPAWVAPVNNSWLYVELDKITGQRSFGYTTVTPIYGPYKPTVDLVENLHWFSTTTNKMYVYKSGNFVEFLRLFVCYYSSGDFFVQDNLAVPPQGFAVQGASGIGLMPFAGSQVGISFGNHLTGRLVYDENDKAVRLKDGTFLTTETPFFVQGSHVSYNTLETSIQFAPAYDTIPAYSIVKLRTDGTLELANYLDTSTTVIGLVPESTLTSDTAQFLVYGNITNDSWDWLAEGYEIGGPLWINTNGLMTGVDPNLTDPNANPLQKAPIARILSRDTIYLFQAGGIKGDAGSGASPLAVLDHGNLIVGDADSINFEGDIAVSSIDDDVTITVTSSPPSPLGIIDTDDNVIVADTNNIKFIGDGVTLSANGQTAIVDISGGGSSQNTMYITNIDNTSSQIDFSRDDNNGGLTTIDEVSDGSYGPDDEFYTNSSYGLNDTATVTFDWADGEYQQKTIGYTPTQTYAGGVMLSDSMVNADGTIYGMTAIGYDDGNRNFTGSFFRLQGGNYNISSQPEWLNSPVALFNLIYSNNHVIGGNSYEVIAGLRRQDNFTVDNVYDNLYQTNNMSSDNFVYIFNIDDSTWTTVDVGYPIKHLVALDDGKIGGFTIDDSNNLFGFFFTITNGVMTNQYAFTDANNDYSDDTDGILYEGYYGKLIPNDPNYGRNDVYRLVYDNDSGNYILTYFDDNYDLYHVSNGVLDFIQGIVTDSFIYNNDPLYDNNADTSDAVLYVVTKDRLYKIYMIGHNVDSHVELISPDLDFNHRFKYEGFNKMVMILDEDGNQFKISGITNGYDSSGYHATWDYYLESGLFVHQNMFNDTANPPHLPYNYSATNILPSNVDSIASQIGYGNLIIGYADTENNTEIQDISGAEETVFRYWGGISNLLAETSTYTSYTNNLFFELDPLSKLSIITIVINTTRFETTFDDFTDERFFTVNWPVMLTGEPGYASMYLDDFKNSTITANIIINDNTFTQSFEGFEGYAILNTDIIKEIPGGYSSIQAGIKLLQLNTNLQLPFGPEQVNNPNNTTTMINRVISGAVTTFPETYTLLEVDYSDRIFPDFVGTQSPA